MPKQAKQQDGVRILKGSLPMTSADGRKYKVRKATTHDFTLDPTVEGKIVQFGTIDVKGDERKFAVIDTGNMLVQVYESAGLKELFSDGDVGDSCKLIYLREKDLGGGKTFKDFNVTVWSA